jgi:hypothetical protein
VTGARQVLMTSEQYDEVNICIEALMRMNRNERASKLMTLALSYKFAKDIEPALPSNVVAFPQEFSRKVGA